MMPVYLAINIYKKQRNISKVLVKKKVIELWILLALKLSFPLF